MEVLTGGDSGGACASDEGTNCEISSGRPIVSLTGRIANVAGAGAEIGRREMLR